MKLVKTGCISLTLATLALFASPATFAGYRITPFDDARGYKAIASGDAQAAVQSFENRNLNRLKFDDLNNLCVSHIMLRQFQDAISTCETALEKLSTDSSVGMWQRRKAGASIHSNLGVARAMNGDSTGANEEFQQALTYDSGHENALNNIEEVRVNLVAGN